MVCSQHLVPWLLLFSLLGVHQSRAEPQPDNPAINDVTDDILLDNENNVPSGQPSQSGDPQPASDVLQTELDNLVSIIKDLKSARKGLSLVSDHHKEGSGDHLITVSESEVTISDDSKADSDGPRMSDDSLRMIKDDQSEPILDRRRTQWRRVGNRWELVRPKLAHQEEEQEEGVDLWNKTIKENDDEKLEQWQLVGGRWQLVGGRWQLRRGTAATPAPLLDSKADFQAPAIHNTKNSLDDSSNSIEDSVNVIDDVLPSKEDDWLARAVSRSGWQQVAATGQWDVQRRDTRAVSVWSPIAGDEDEEAGGADGDIWESSRQPPGEKPRSGRFLQDDDKRDKEVEDNAIENRKDKEDTPEQEQDADDDNEEEEKKPPKLNVSDKDSPYALLDKYFPERESYFYQNRHSFKNLFGDAGSGRREEIGNLQPKEVWLVDDNLVVVRGGSTPDRDGFDNPWPPLDSFQAPYREPVLPPPDFDPDSLELGVGISIEELLEQQKPRTTPPPPPQRKPPPGFSLTTESVPLHGAPVTPEQKLAAFNAEVSAILRPFRDEVDNSWQQLTAEHEADNNSWQQLTAQHETDNNSWQQQPQHQLQKQSDKHRNEVDGNSWHQLIAEREAARLPDPGHGGGLKNLQNAAGTDEDDLGLIHNIIDDGDDLFRAVRPPPILEHREQPRHSPLAPSFRVPINRRPTRIRPPTTLPPHVEAQSSTSRARQGAPKPNEISTLPSVFDSSAAFPSFISSTPPPRPVIVSSLPAIGHETLGFFSSTAALFPIKTTTPTTTTERSRVRHHNINNNGHTPRQRSTTTTPLTTTVSPVSMFTSAASTTTSTAERTTPTTATVARPTVVSELRFTARSPRFEKSRINEPIFNEDDAENLVLTDYEREQYFKVLHPNQESLPSPSWSPLTVTAASVTAPTHRSSARWDNIVATSPKAATTGEDWIVPTHTSSLLPSWWQQPATGNRAVAMPDDTRGSSNGHGGGGSTRPVLPVTWSPSPTLPTWSEVTPLRSEGGANGQQPEQLGQQLRQLAASALPFSQFLPLLGGGENGWAQKLLGGPPKPEATPRSGADVVASALDRRSSQEQQQRLYRPRAEAEEVEEGEDEEPIHAQFGKKIQPTRNPERKGILGLAEALFSSLGPQEEQRRSSRQRRPVQQSARSKRPPEPSRIPSERAGTGDVRYVSFVSGVRGGGSWGYSYNL